MRLFSVVEVGDTGYIVPGLIAPEHLKYSVSQEIENMIDALNGEETLVVTVLTCAYSDSDISNEFITQEMVDTLKPITKEEFEYISSQNLAELKEKGFVRILTDIDKGFEAPEEENEIIELFM